MKKNLLMFAALFFSAVVFSQSKVNLVVFSEDGDPFYTYINGVRQNDKPETNVKVTGISPNISLRIVFENKALPDLKQNMALEAGFEHTARIKKDPKKGVKLRYFGQTPISDEPTPGMATVAYHSAENPSPAQNETSATQVHTGQTTVMSTTTTTTKGNSASENVSVNVNMSGVGIQMNVAGVDAAQPGNVQSTTSTTVTRSSSATGQISDSRTPSPEQPVQTVNKVGCAGPMSAAGFSEMKKTVESKPFSETRMSTAKVATRNNCLSISQVKEICKLFSMDEDKLTYAKYAYEYCVERPDYYKVSEVFSFSSTTDEFNKFLED
jgi:hypothetical protein